MLDKIKTMLGQITPGPWISKEYCVVNREDAVYGYPPKPGVICGLDDGEYIENSNCKNDAEFIAASPEMFQWAVQEIERLRGTLEQISFNAEKAEFTSMHGANNFKGFIRELADEALKGESP